MSPTLGLELRDTAALAVAVDGEGVVLARAVVRADDQAAAALGALDSVAGAAGAGPLGLATNYPDAALSDDSIRAIGARYSGPFLHHGPLPAGAAAAAGEAWTGAARNVRDAAFLAVGHHVTGGIVNGGVPLVGARSRAVSMAWLALNPVEREDYRKIGCLEAEVAAAGIVRRLIWRVKAGDASRAADPVHGDLSLVTVDHVLEAARAGDGVCISVVRDTARYVGMAAANLLIVAGAEMLVLGGIVAASNDLLFEAVRSEISRRLPRPMGETISIVPAALGDDAAAIGAARVAAISLK
jgi:glucokinase